MSGVRMETTAQLPAGQTLVLNCGLSSSTQPQPQLTFILVTPKVQVREDNSEVTPAVHVTP
jgi:hypothetical protein